MARGHGAGASQYCFGPMFGHRRLAEIKTDDVQTLTTRLAKNKPKTVNTVLNALSVILRVAAKWGVVEQMSRHVELLKARRSGAAGRGACP